MSTSDNTIIIAAEIRINENMAFLQLNREQTLEVDRLWYAPMSEWPEDLLRYSNKVQQRKEEFNEATKIY